MSATRLIHRSFIRTRGVDLDVHLRPTSTSSAHKLLLLQLPAAGRCYFCLAPTVQLHARSTRGSANSLSFKQRKKYLFYFPFVDKRFEMIMPTYVLLLAKTWFG